MSDKEKSNDSLIIEYKFTKQTKEALEAAAELVKADKRELIMSQDLLSALASTVDSGANYALGRYSITKTKILKEIEAADLVKERMEIVLDERDNYLGNPERRQRQLRARWLKANPVEFLPEAATQTRVKYAQDLFLSENVKNILEFAEEMRFQNVPEGGMDSYWILIGMVQDEASNACQVIEKLMLKYDPHLMLSLEDIQSRFSIREGHYHWSDFRDGRAEEERQKKAAESEQISHKLDNPDYSILEDIATDLTEKAEKGLLQPVIGREKELKSIEVALVRRDKNNVALLGEGGVGKSAIVEGLAIKIVNQEIPSLKGKKILQFSLKDLNAALRWEYNRGVLRFIDEMAREKNVILFIDEIHMLWEGKSLTDSLKPVMARSDFRIIGATTPREWQDYIARDSALVRRFEKITVAEPSLEDTQKIVKAVIPVYENHYNLHYNQGAISGAVKLAKRYLLQERLPDSAFTVIDNAGALVSIEGGTVSKANQAYDAKLKRLKNKLKQLQAVEFPDREQIDKVRQKMSDLQADFQKSRNKMTSNPQNNLRVGVKDVKKAVALKTGIPLKDIKVSTREADRADSLERLKQLPERLSQKIIGQSEAIDAISRAVIRSKTGFRNPHRPVGVYLFLGTSGVGKTETAKTLASEMFGQHNRMIRIDMSEFQEEHTVSKLIGAPPGYVGFEGGGQLTNKVRQEPYSVILFDEIEKAHPKIFDILLQVFDDGILTDGNGVTTDFKETIIVMTSNLGMGDSQQTSGIGFGQLASQLDYDYINNNAQTAIKSYFRPEFLNRIDEIVTFKPFDEQALFGIASLLLKEEQALIADQGIDARFDEKAAAFIAQTCSDPINGARPLKRGITRLVEDKLSSMLINGDIKRGDRILITADKEIQVLKQENKKNRS